jgi:Holliday junction resolvase-like predicted endonuclease
MYHFTQLGWKCIGHRKKLYFSEVDLILSKDDHILLIEVKSLHNEWMAFERVPHRQIQSLIKNKILYQVANPKLKIECRVCFVSSHNVVEEVYID